MDIGTLVLVTLSMCSLVAPAAGCGRGSIYIENNEYKQILVAIGHNVTENPTLIQKIKDVFSDASQLLYAVTRKRAYFGGITILVPTTWSDKPEYEAAGQETIDKSDVLVDSPDERFDHGHRPFVIKTTECGELGHYMHLTPEYLLDVKAADQYGPYDKVLVHEWAHLRYGVYDEYPLENSGQHFYANGVGEIEATRCSAAIRGDWFNRATGDDWCSYSGNLPEADCRFRDRAGISGKYGSLMYKTTLTHISEFCDNDVNNRDTLHNAEAPTQQNINCNGKSVWEVLREHPDFEVFNQPRNVTEPLPKFRVVRPKNTGRTVLVLDVSGSMGPSYDNSIAQLGQACSNYISSIVNDGEQVGIVWFNNTGIPVVGLTPIDKNSRTQLLQYIPRLARGATSIGGGIRQGVTMLHQGGGAIGGQLIVVSDGEENRAPWLKDVWDETVNSGVTVHSVAITDAADSTVDALAVATGGLSFLYSASDRSNALNEAFQAIGDLNQNPTDRAFTLVSAAETVKKNDQVSAYVSFDSSLGRNTEFIFDFSGSDIDAILTSPQNTKYDKNSNECAKDSTFGIYRFRFPGIIERGKWMYEVINTENKAQRVAVSVTSQTAVEGQHPILAQAFWGKRDLSLIVPGRDPSRQTLYCSVSQGYAPVLYADVLATVERPGNNASPVDVVLLDNGSGADKVKGDGIYSAYFIGVNSNGRYNVKVAVNSTSATVVKPRRIIGQGAPRGSNGVQFEDPDVPINDLQRTASGGSFELENYQSLPGGKIYSPGKITDLRVVSSSYKDKQVTLTWTAVGDQLDVGTASGYDLRLGTSFVEMRENFDAQEVVLQQSVVSGGNLSAPLPSGSQETFEISVPDHGDLTYYFAVKATDTEGRDVRGELSAIAMASMADLPDNSATNGVNVGMVVGVIVGVAAGVGLIVAFVLLVLKPKIQTKTPNNAELSAHDKKNHLPPLDQHSSNVGTAQFSPAPLPPIKSNAKGVDNKGYLHRTGGNIAVS